jgi:hypothetical protein
VSLSTFHDLPDEIISAEERPGNPGALLRDEQRSGRKQRTLSGRARDMISTFPKCGNKGVPPRTKEEDGARPTDPKHFSVLAQRPKTCSDCGGWRCDLRDLT